MELDITGIQNLIALMPEIDRDSKDNAHPDRQKLANAALTQLDKFTSEIEEAVKYASGYKLA